MTPARFPAPPDRIAVFADVHGNADALTAVLADIDRHSPGLIVNLGDHFSSPLAAGETATLLAARPQILSIRGNHDRYLIGSPADMGGSDRAALAELTPETLNCLRSLPATALLGDDILLCHATPLSDDTYLAERVTPTGEVILDTDDGIAARLGPTPPLVLCAHSHLPRDIRLSDGRRIVNPGSAGCPAYHDHTPVPHNVETGSPDASYALLDRMPSGWQVTFRRIAYDPSRMAAKARAHGRADWEIGTMTGRMPR